MPRDFVRTISELDIIPKRLFLVLASYLFFLTLFHRRHSFKSASLIGEIDESRFSSALNRPEIFPVTRQLFSRLRRRALKSFLKRAQGRLSIIIDSTFQQRRSQLLENVHRYHTGTGFVTAHKFTNMVLADQNGRILPLDTIAILTKAYCKKQGREYVSEYEVAARWIEGLVSYELLDEERLKQCVFLLDAGFDTRRIQNAIKGLGSNFVVAIKSSRSVSGRSVHEYFKRHRNLAWSTIRLTVGSGKKSHQRKYSIRTAKKVNLKGVGEVCAVWSKAHGHARKPKYLAASDLSLTPRQIIQWYAKRWSIELWHRQMKQKHGYADCHCRRFSAVDSHVQLSLSAYLLNFENQEAPQTLENYLRIRDLKTIKKEITRYGAAERIKALISEGLAALAA